MRHSDGVDFLFRSPSVVMRVARCSIDKTEQIERSVRHQCIKRLYICKLTLQKATAHCQQLRHQAPSQRMRKHTAWRPAMYLSRPALEGVARRMLFPRGARINLKVSTVHSHLQQHSDSPKCVQPGIVRVCSCPTRYAKTKQNKRWCKLTGHSSRVLTPVFIYLPSLQCGSLSQTRH